MSHEPEFTRVVRSWLEEGVDRLPDRVFDSVLEQLPTTPQRRHVWSAWRLRSMTNIVRLPVVAGAVVVAAVAGIQPAPPQWGWRTGTRSVGRTHSVAQSHPLAVTNPVANGRRNRRPQPVAEGGHV